MELYSPPYLDWSPLPTITAAPSAAAHGAVVTVTTPEAPAIATVSLVRPHALTHHTDAGHRCIRLPITVVTAGSIDVRLPTSGYIAPPCGTRCSSSTTQAPPLCSLLNLAESDSPPPSGPR